MGEDSEASDLKMSVELQVEFGKEQDAHILCRRIVTLWPDPRRMRRDFVSPCDDAAKLFSQVLARAKCLCEDADEINQGVGIPNEAIANQPIVRVTAKINVTKVLTSLLDTLLFRPLNLLTQILEPFHTVPKKSPASFRRALVEKSNIEATEFSYFGQEPVAR
jgi:hypothetical protein